MQSKLIFSLLLAILFLNIDDISSQKIWQKIEKSNYTLQKKEVYQKESFPSDYQIISLDVAAFSNVLKSKSTTNKDIIELPNSNGTLFKFQIKETSNFEAGLQDKYPNIKSYTAQGIDDPTAVAKISLGTDGFHAVIFSGKQETIYIDPYSKDNKELIVYKKNSLSKVDEDFSCQVEDVAKKEISFSSFRKNADDGKLRTFRLALVCSAEYAQFHLGASQQNVSNNATDAVKKEAVLSAMNTSITRINGIFEKDLAVKLVLVANNDEVIFLDTDTDGITDGNPNTMINEVQSICDTKIGDANYDIGHIFSVGGDGLASLGVVCISGQKARGVTGRAQPVGDPYDIDYVVHELGHQFGATHTQNNECNRTYSTAVEPGSGSTIMGYAGICAPNVKEGNANGNSDDYFHAVSIAQMWTHIQGSGSCATISNTGNAAPTANAGLDYSIPKSTPFKLEGVATDIDGLSSLTYNWEQLDNEVFLDEDDNPVMPPSTTNATGPMFRSLPSKDSSIRYFPALSTVINGATSSEWEVLPSVARDLNFSFLVRDNHAGGGSTARDDMLVEVVDAEVFSVTSQNTEESFISGENISVNWIVGTTNQSPIDCQNVNIKLSVDGGLTFPILLKTNTPNDGTEDIIIPDNATTNARIMVEAADNIFYNVNASKFTIISSTPTFLITDNSGEQSVCNTENQSISYTLHFDFINGFTETATLSATGNPTGATVSFSQTTINEDGDVIVTISNLNGIEVGSYPINVLAESATVSQKINLALKVETSSFNILNLSLPSNGATNISLVEVLSWENDENASSYNVEVASDSNFNSIVTSGNVLVNSYTSKNLSADTQYFWRVKPMNNCGEGSFSETFSFTTEIPTYCSSTFTDETGGSEYISNVTFSGINNTSDNDTSDGYQDFTSINGDVSRGQTKQISVTLDTAGYQDHCFVFVDWNQDYVFDNETERYDLGSLTESVGTLFYSIKVPDDAKYGKTRLRVVVEYDDPTANYGDGACDTDHLSEWGETEDYSVTVVRPEIDSNNFLVLTTSESCMDENDGIIDVKMSQEEFTYQVSITNASTIIQENLLGTSYSFLGLKPDDYEVCIYAEELDYTQCFQVTIDPSEEIALKVANKSATMYSFKIDSGTAPYNVYLNDNLITVSNTKEFDVEIVESGKLEVKTAKDCEGLYKTSIGNILLKRNPVIDSIDLLLPLNIGKTDINAVIYDINGKLIYNKILKTENNNLSIPFKDYALGVYILKLSIQNSKPIKIIKQ